MYTQYQLSAGTISPTPKIIADEVTFLKTEVATIFLFYCCLWSIKLSFLIFFRRLGQRVRGQKIWWWFVLALTVVTWATCIGDIQYPCLLNSLEYIMSTLRLLYYVNVSILTLCSTMLRSRCIKLSMEHTALELCG